jgi:basic membrane protein A
MVTDTGGIDDRSFNASSWQGMQEAASADSSIKVTYLQSSTQGDYIPNINTFLSQKCGIIVTVGFLMGSATETAAKAHPSQDFAIVDCSYASECLTGTKESNIDQLTFNTVQDGFLGGYLAAGMTKTGKVATFGGEDFGTVTIYMDGFWDGVQYYRRALSPATSPTRPRARRSPRRSSARARTSSSRSRVTSGSARPRRSRTRTTRRAARR